jgi:hypothetical protein
MQDQGGDMTGFTGIEIFEDADKNTGCLVSNESIAQNLPQKGDKPQIIAQGLTLGHKTEVLSSNATITAAQTVFSKDFNNQELSTGTPALVIHTPNEKRKKREDMTEKFVQQFNGHRGNREMVAKAERLLKQNRALANLEAAEGEKYVDIPSARRNFVLLAKLANQEIKMKALDNLIQVLNKDDISPNTAFELIVLAIDLMKEMNRELIQTQLVDEQIKICQAYGIIAELIQRHYAEKHLGGITMELHQQLAETAKTLEDLNTHGDPRLHFAVEYALEGIKRLHDDRKELFELCGGIYYLLVSAVAFYGTDISTFNETSSKILKNLDVRITNSWYDVTLLFNEFAKDAQNDISKLILMQAIVGEKCKDLDWKFLYNAIEKFEYLAIHGETPEIRKRALMGEKHLTNSDLGILDFLNFDKFPRKTNLKPIIHFKPPVLKDNNVIIRYLCNDVLVNIAKESPDIKIRKKAKRYLLQSLKQKKDQLQKGDIKRDRIILEMLERQIPLQEDEQKKWVEEEVGYSFIPLRKTRERSRSRSRSREREIKSDASERSPKVDSRRLSANYSLNPSEMQPPNFVVSSEDDSCQDDQMPASPPQPPPQPSPYFSSPNSIIVKTEMFEKRKK